MRVPASPSRSLVLAAAAVISVLPDTLTHLLAGQNWHIAKHLLLPVAIWMAASAARQAPASVISALGHSRKVLTLSIITGLTTVAGALTGAAIGGAGGAAWGYAIAQIAILVLWWSSLPTDWQEPNLHALRLKQRQNVNLSSDLDS